MVFPPANFLKLAELVVNELKKYLPIFIFLLNLLLPNVKILGAYVWRN